ncbi:MAG: hypothetical protein KF760_25430 [Candidatus Eremiobacteraeota bacterium]|nr:hypothetical protein [Candidatus Eremiobacteraeota bacterium]MCW5866819.1 hypothetical protein [Candidatus Eremiobacteraeota bacterium]
MRLTGYCLLGLLLAGCAGNPSTRKEPENVSVDPSKLKPVARKNPMPQPPNDRLPPPADASKPPPPIDGAVPGWGQAVITGKWALGPVQAREIYQQVVNEHLLRRDWDWLESEARRFQDPSRVREVPPPLDEFYRCFREIPEEDLYHPEDPQLQRKALKRWVQERPRSDTARVALSWNLLAEAWRVGRQKSDELAGQARQAMEGTEASKDPEVWCLQAELALLSGEPEARFEAAIARCPGYYRAQLLNCARHSNWFRGSEMSDWEKGLDNDDYYWLIAYELSREPIARSDRHQPSSRGPMVTDYPRALRGLKSLLQQAPDRTDWMFHTVDLAGGRDVQWARKMLRELGPQVEEVRPQTLQTSRRLYLAGEAPSRPNWVKLRPIEADGLGLDQWILRTQVHRLVSLHRFAELEEVGSHFKSDKRRLHDGGSRYRVFLNAIEPILETSDSPSQMRAFFTEWEKAYPKSAFLPIALATYLVNRGWSSIDVTGSDEGNFETARQVLKESGDRSAESSFLRMRMARAQQEPVEKYFREIVRVQPDFFPAYKELALSASDTADLEGKILDARRPIARALMTEAVLRRGIRIQVKDAELEKSFQALEGLTGWSGWRQHLLFCAAAAARAELAKRTLRKIEGQSIDPKIFGSLEAFDEVVAWAKAAEFTGAR